MALPDPRTILLAKSYAHQIEIGRTPQQALAYIDKEFPAPAYVVRSAIRQAQKAMRVGEVLEDLPAAARIRDALEGQRAPAPRVGVRVEVTRHRVENGVDTEWRRNTLYIEVNWDDPKQVVLDKVAEYLVSIERDSGEETYSEIAFVGPSLWPGQTVTNVGRL